MRSSAVKEAAYQQTLQGLQALLEGETDPVAVMAAAACELYRGIPWIDWIGFYRLIAPDTLLIGPYQGPRACLRIPVHRGVCGRAVREKAPQIVGDVTQVPWHIACSPSTRSEIVIPLFGKGGGILGVLDADSNEPEAFDQTDLAFLRQACRFLETPGE